MDKENKKIHQLDASGQVAGRLAAKIAVLLMGKDKPGYRPHIDSGNTVEIINAGQLKFTGNKLAQKEYIWHTNHPGGLRRKKMSEVFEKNPGDIIRRAVLGMLPKNKLRDQMIKRLKISK